MSRSFPIVLFCLTFSMVAVEAVKFTGGDTFIAAVYEHALIIPPPRSDVVTRDEALINMDKNLDVLEQKALLAKDAHILVFPEDGLYGFELSSQHSIYPYMEYIPEPKPGLQWCPCDDTGNTTDIAVQKRLSCMAKNNDIYLAANMGDKQPCMEKTDDICPSSGNFIYNTNVVFANNGCLVAKYHKENLFLVEPFNKPKTPEYAYFDTPFGRFGTFTCFDILFKEPAVELVERFGVDHVLFPTAWMNVFPLFASIETHSGFARMMGVNLLAANIHLPAKNMVGSGIYTPQGYAGFSFNASDPAGQLVMSPLQRKPTPNTPYNQTSVRSCTRPVEDHLTFRSYMFGDSYSWMSLDKDRDNICVCQDQVCCHLEYSMQGGLKSEIYALGAFDGLHTLEGQYYIQACALVKCANYSKSSCGSPTQVAHTTFGQLHLRGEFDTKYIFPEVLASPVSLDIGTWTYGNGSIESNGAMTKPLLSAMLLGRWYDKDSDQSGNFSRMHDKDSEQSGAFSCMQDGSLFKIVILLCIFTASQLRFMMG